MSKDRICLRFKRIFYSILFLPQKSIQKATTKANLKGYINLQLKQWAARPNAEQFSLCVADRLVLTFCFFFVKEKENTLKSS
jgi:hypothetical protein